jgi:hypothetical protein
LNNSTFGTFCFELRRKQGNFSPVFIGSIFVYNKPMNKQADSNSHILYRITTLLVIVFILISCEPFTTTVPETTLQQPSENPQATPYPPPAIFQSSHLNPLDTPRAYVQDSCIYLMNKWNRLNAAPGTVVMIIMFDETEIPDFDRMMEQLKAQGFNAINTQQFLAFMERNIKIPPRSVLIIQDDSHPVGDFKKFRVYWEKWGWPVVNGWVSDPKTPESVWQENIALENEGWVDHQPQGVIPGTVLSDDSSKVVISRELKGSITAFAEQYAKSPIAFIWPGGGFGQRPVEAARQLGYQLGFTSNSRGPVMYNWVPLADEFDPARPTYIPEGTIKDPLMTLPRYSPDQILDAIDLVRLTGNEANAYALANKAAEFEYYDSVCEPIYGKIPTP